MGFIMRVFGETLKILVVVLAITFIPGIPPHVEFEAFSVTPPLPLEGSLALNDKLNNAEKLFYDDIKGPEHMEVHNGVLYTTLEGGYVAKLVGDKIVPVVKFGKKCDGLHEVEICGRPLGLSFDSKGLMYAADAYYGIFKVNVSTGEYEQLVSLETEIGGKKPRLPNSLTVDKDGAVYWSDSSSSHSLHDGMYSALANGNGRLIKYDQKTKTNTVLIDNLHIANGVALSSDESFVVVSDLFRSRIMKYNLKGSNKGQAEVFVDGLPGYPDNIHSNKKGEFHVTLPLAVDKDNIGVSALLGPYPLIRQFLARFIYLLELPALQINLYYPNYYTQVYTHWVGSLGMIPVFPSSKRISVVFFNEEGKITKSLHCTDGKIQSITDFASLNNYYYLGSFTNPYLARVKAS